MKQPYLKIFIGQKLLVIFMVVCSSLINVSAIGQTSYYVNDNATTGDIFCSAVGSNSNSGTASAPFATLAYGISQASAGDIIYVDAGTYTENLAVSKRLQIIGVDSSSTIITAAAAGTSTIVYSVGGLNANNRQVLKNVRVTGASGGTGNNNSGILISGGSMSYFTFDGIAATGNTGSGLVSNVAPATSTLSYVAIKNSSFRNNGANGMRTASHSVDSVTISDCRFTNNTALGLAFNSSDNTTATIGGVALTTVVFSGNNSVADLYAFRMHGNMSLNNVDFLGSNGSGSFGFYLLGGYVNEASAPAIGTVTLNDVTISGTYTSAGISFLGYNSLAGVSMTDVVLNTSVPTADRGHMRLSGVAGTLDLGNTSFNSANAPLDIRLGSNFGASGSQSSIQVNATNATFNGVLGSAMTLSQLFATEDRIRHGCDNTTDATGFVRVKAGNVFVTPNSGSVNRAIVVATAGDIVNINDGTYTAQAITVNKRMDIRGQGNNTIIQNSGSDVFTYTAAGSGSSSGTRAYLKNLKISGSAKGLSASDVVNYLTLDGVNFDGNSSYAIHLNNTTGTMLDWVITNSNFNANSDGFRMGMAANVDGLSITNNTFTNQTAYGVYIPQQASPKGGCSNATISGNTFTGNGSSNNMGGLYVEKMNAGTISNNTFTNNGTSQNPRAIIVNLKFDTYSNITISGNTITENRGGTQLNSINGYGGYGIYLAARNDAGSYNTVPASLSTASVSSNSITGFYAGIGVANAVDWNTTSVTNNTITGSTNGIYAELYGTGNTVNSGKTLNINDNSIDASSKAILNLNSGATINATCNWYGTTVSANIAAKIYGPVTFSPWLTSGTDSDGSSIGFQPVSGSCVGVPLSLNESHVNVVCSGGTTGSINLTVSGGTSPFSYVWTKSGDVSYSASTQDLSDLASGTYTVIVTDADNATATISVEITSGTISYPVITTQPTKVGKKLALNLPAEPYTITVAANSSLTYQWYKNTTASNSGGVLIAGATSNSYTPPTSTSYTAYFYCVVTNENSCSRASDVSEVFIVCN